SRTGSPCRTGSRQTSMRSLRVAGILTGAHARVVQLHPTRRCNLECLHCYSSSVPAARGELAPAVVAEALAVFAREGYNVAAVSGGEPLLYSGLPAIIDAARACGMAITVTTNGTLLTDARIPELVGRVD